MPTGGVSLPDPRRACSATPLAPGQGRKRAKVRTMDRTRTLAYRSRNVSRQDRE